MNNYLDRIQHFKGNPYEIGFAAGRTLGAKLEQTINHYIASREYASDMIKLHQGALPWLRRLPKRFQDELEGMAEGANLPLQRLAEWSYIEECESKHCSGAVGLFDQRAWIARNNDSYVPELWGYATIREVEGRIPTICFSMECDVFAPTGINQERLWLHYNFLSAWDEPRPGRPHVPPYVFLTEALELCHTISDVEALLNRTDRDGGMLLFAVDGKDNEFALFECMCSKHYRRQPSNGWIVGTNHFCACEDLTLSDADKEPLGTLSRFAQMENLVQALSASQTPPNLPTDLIQTLADDAIESSLPCIQTWHVRVAAKSGTHLEDIPQQARETGKNLRGRGQIRIPSRPNNDTCLTLVGEHQLPKLWDAAHRALGAGDDRLPSGARTLHQARDSGGVDLPRWTHHRRDLAVILLSLSGVQRRFVHVDEQIAGRFEVVVEEGSPRGDLYELEQKTYHRVVDRYSNQIIMVFESLMEASLSTRTGLWDDYRFTGVSEVSIAPDEQSVIVKYHDGLVERVVLPQ